jgi:hypothetical protein
MTLSDLLQCTYRRIEVERVLMNGLGELVQAQLAVAVVVDDAELPAKPGDAPERTEATPSGHRTSKRISKRGGKQLAVFRNSAEAEAAPS